MEPLHLNGVAMQRRHFLGLAVAATASTFPALQLRAEAGGDPLRVLTQWYRLVLELVRHTATYSPPVASRAFAYLGVTAYEALATGTPALHSLAGQLTDLTAFPDQPATFDPALVLHGAMTQAVRHFFGNTGPTGQRAMDAMEKRLGEGLHADHPADHIAASLAFGQSVADHVIAWAATDGGELVENMGFPLEYALTDGPAHWVPTSAIRLQQSPLLPNWGNNRPFALPAAEIASGCGLPAPTPYSEDPASAFYAEAAEVVATKAALTDEQKLIARYWSDDPMLSPTPPGHWLAIVLQIIDRDGLPADRAADALMRLGVAVADGFIACWASKYRYDLVRPVTYIRRLMDPAWEPLLITPPFPEYPSGHSTQSGAAAAVLTAIFGPDFAFTDAIYVDDGLGERHFASFDAAAEEAAISRIYGGIHTRPAIAFGLTQGACIGAYTVKLRTLA